MSSPVIHISHMCAFRPVGDGAGNNLEVLLIRSPFGDSKENRPADFPGEWMFPFAVRQYGDRSMAKTACRAFEEQLGYRASFYHLTFIRSYPNPSDAQIPPLYDPSSRAYVDYHEEFYSAQIDHELEFSTDPSRVFEHAWFPVSGAHSYVTSPLFEQEQLHVFHALGLDDTCHGPYTTKERRIHPFTHRVLRRIYREPHLLYSVQVE